MSHPSRFLSIENVGMTFPTKKGDFVALLDVNLNVARGEFIALIGHSGCGKSTLLNLVAGLTTPTSGVMLLEDRELRGPGPNRAGNTTSASAVWPRTSAWTWPWRSAAASAVRWWWPVTARWSPTCASSPRRSR